MGFPVGVDEAASYGGKPYATYGLLVANTAIFILLRVAYPFLGFPSWDSVLRGFGTYPADVLNPSSLYRVFTAMFLHANLLHLVVNMFYLLIFGSEVEHVMGAARFTAFYLAGGVLAAAFNTVSEAVVPALINQTQSAEAWLTPAVGASGAISAVLGAALILFPKARVMSVLYVLPLSMSVKVYVLIWFAYQLLLAIYAPGLGIAFWAHIGGLLSGIGLTPIFIDRRRLERMRSRVRLVREAGL
ncbi:MAG: rhomboid family intramembrane serine protease [Desulfurococcales archaeon]|nr:rhomboid family intramembrane serine protease [Desulfurococcales archaeon]